MRKALGVVTALIVATAGLAVASARPAATQSDLDAFMAQVLAKRDENWKKLQQYVLDERERIDVRAMANMPVWGDVREYTWFIRDGFFVRSPVKANGVTIGEADRRKYENDFLKRAKARDKKREGPTDDPKAADASADPVAEEIPKDFDALLSQSREPQFIDSAYFLKFKFESGRYALVGREQLAGRDVLKIEYYPSRLFSHEQDAADKRAKEQKTSKNKDMDAQLERMMNKISLVTIWVEPKAHQILKYTFDNVNLDFLPGAWIIRLDDLKATMTMSEAFKDVWLPRDVDMFFAATLAVGPFNVRYHLDYYDYRQATTSGRIKGGPADQW